MRLLSSVRFWVTALVIAALASACGGGNELANGGIGGTGISFGTITNFGSIYVNGVRFDTAEAEIVIEDRTVGRGDMTARDRLALGQVVAVHGTISDDGVNGVADVVYYDDNLEAPVTTAPTVDAGTGRWLLAVLGQPVLVDPNATVITFDDKSNATANVADLAVHDIVEVSGLPDDKGVIHASYLRESGKFVNKQTSIELKGTISAVDAQSKTLTLNNYIRVDYANAEIEGLSGGPSVGRFVEVSGNELADKDVLVARQIEAEHERFDTPDAEKVEIEGIITQVTVPGSEFKIGSQTVQYDAETKFEGRGSIADGQRLEVDGTLSNGVVKARKIEFDD